MGGKIVVVKVGMLVSRRLTKIGQGLQNPSRLHFLGMHCCEIIESVDPKSVR